MHILVSYVYVIIFEPIMRGLNVFPFTAIPLNTPPLGVALNVTRESPEHVVNPDVIARIGVFIRLISKNPVSAIQLKDAGMI